MKRDRTRQWIALGRTAPDEVVGPPGDWENASVVRTGCVAPVVQLVRAARPRVFAISGPVGAGKSTIAGAVARSLANVGISALALSLDDFYLPREERKRRGIAWRAAPGSHDLDLTVRTLAAVHDGSHPLVVPRFDMSRDDRGADERLDVSPEVVVFDGWIIGYDGQGYDQILPYLDWHLHLDVPKDVARARRFDREARLRETTGRAFSAEEMQRFWDEVLGPGIDTWVPASAAHADIVVGFTDNRPSCLAEPRLDAFLPSGGPASASDAARQLASGQGVHPAGRIGRGRRAEVGDGHHHRPDVPEKLHRGFEGGCATTRAEGSLLPCEAPTAARSSAARLCEPENRGAMMAEGLILAFEGVGETEYYAVNSELGIDMVAGTGDIPDGLLLHAAGTADDGKFVVTEVWASREAQGAFMSSRLGPALAAGGVTAAPTVTWVPLLAYRTFG